MHRIILFCIMMCAGATAAHAEPVADFYRGKTVNVVIGHEAATGFDIFARLFVRYAGRHIPGQPSVVPQNLIGAGGLKAANWLATLAPKDGTAMLVVSPEAVFRSLYGDTAATFDPVKLTWIGNMDQSVATCLVTDRSGITGIQQLFDRDALFGVPGGGLTAMSQMTEGVINFVGAKLKIVQGYQGTGDVKLAMLRGEIEGTCGVSLSTLQTQWKDDVASGRLRPILQFGMTRSPALPDIPAIYEFAKSDEDREIFDIAFGTHILGRPVIAPPGVPDDRVQALRMAFTETMQDADYDADVKRLGLTTTPSSGAEVEKLVARLFSYPKSIIDKANARLHGKP